jgi:uncharacterized repeat protein (TIGR03803 family)
VFKVHIKPSRETILHSFTGTGGDGALPMAGLVRDAAGNLYGTTVEGRAYGGQCGGFGGCGTIFKIDPTGKETVLYVFTGETDGQAPGGLLRDLAGNLYGTTAFGGAGAAGTVFKLDASGKKTVLYSFTGGTDGDEPVGPLVRDKGGNFYGVTNVGGGKGCSSGCGTVFKLSKAGKETILYRFTGGVDGAYPVAGLLRDKAGNLYGTTLYGGDAKVCSPGCGVVFEVTP